MQFFVTGMTCDHCVHAVTEELMALAQVTAVQIDLVPGGASTVNIDLVDEREIDGVREAVAEAGYEILN